MLKNTAQSGVKIFSSPTGKPILIVPPAEETFHSISVIASQKEWWKIQVIYPDNGQTVSIDEAWVRIKDSESSPSLSDK